MKKNIIAILIFITSVFTTTTLQANDKETKEWMVGTELDLVPYINDGYYASVVAGYDHWRARFVLTDITTPDFVTQKNFNDNQLKVNAYIIDYYFKKGFHGWWIGPGFEIWQGNVTEESSKIRKSYKTFIFTLGGGYTFRFNDHFYLNPWAALHIPVGGDRKIQFINETFKINATPEASVKIGINF